MLDRDTDPCADALPRHPFGAGDVAVTHRGRSTGVPYDAPMPEDDWETQLAQGFEILLRAPLTTFDPDATYAFHHWDEVVSDDFFDEDLDLALLTGGAVVGAPFDGVPALADPDEDETLSWKDWRVDLGRSVFLIDTDIPKLGKPRPGTHVGKVLAARGLTAEDLAEDLVHLDARIHTDGTLFDAMRHATWTMGGPDRLVPFDPECVVQPKWERRLAAVGHDGLRDHLRMLCLDAHSARCAGAHYVRNRHPGFNGMRKAGGRVVAAWELGEAQAYSVVTALPPEAP